MIGTYGYDCAEWNTTYYPEMLPHDWRFCFFSNQFRAVLIPGEVLRNIDAATIAQWREDSDPKFRFVLEVGADQAPEIERLMQMLIPLGAQVAGWILSNNTTASDTAIRALASTTLPIAVDTSAAEFARLRTAFPAVRLTRVWRPTQEEFGSQEHAGFTVALVDRIEMRSLRVLLERLRTGVAQGDTAGLFFLPSAQAPRLAQEARVLTELMG